MKKIYLYRLKQLSKKKKRRSERFKTFLTEAKVLIKDNNYNAIYATIGWYFLATQSRDIISGYYIKVPSLQYSGINCIGKTTCAKIMTCTQPLCGFSDELRLPPDKGAFHVL